MKKILSITILSALSLCSQAQAADLSYNYVQAGLINLNVKASLDQDLSTSETLKGYNLKGSFAAGDNFYVFGGYRDADKSYSLEGESAKLGVNEVNIGLGYRIEATENADWLFEVEYLNDEVNITLDTSVLSGSYGLDADGFRAGLGLRGKASDKVELYGKINYSNLGKATVGDYYLDFGNGFGAELGAAISLNDTWAVTVEYQLDNREETDFSQFGLGVRASF